MKKIAGLVTVIFLVAALHIHAQDRGLSVVAGENLGQQANIGKQYALFIAIDAYRNWPALKKPVADAREIRDILRQDYYIDEVIELYNQAATKAAITRTFTELQTKLGVHDSLFIYYAGHGHYDASSTAGFWIPIDGGTDQFAQENWLPNSQIRGYISRFKTIHVFMISDACFSGDILSTTRALPPQIDNAYFRKAYALTSRQVLTSGSSETVPDQSEFSSALINCLRKNTSPLLDPLGIYNDVRLSVRSTTPLYGTLNQANHQDGATFLFFRRSSPVASAATPQPAPAPVVQPAAPPVNPPQQPTYKIGDRGPAGGIIFYDKGNNSNGWRYMEAAPTDLGIAEWGLDRVNVTGTGTGIGDGKRNTELIIATLNRKGASGRAAQLCGAYTLNGYRDWFLPSKDELDLMYKNLKQRGLGGFRTTVDNSKASHIYFSSSQCDEISSNFVWAQGFDGGSQDFFGKIFSRSVRAVRAF